MSDEEPVPGKWLPEESGLDKKTAPELDELSRIIADSSPIGVYIVQDGKFIFVNPQFREKSGFSENELLMRSPLEIVHPEDREPVRNSAVRMLKGESVQPYEFRIIDKKGEIRWALETVSSILYRGKRATLGNFIDITVNKQSEEALRESEEFRSGLLNISPNPIFVVNPDTSIRYVNPAMEQLTGFSAAEIIGIKAPYPWWREKYIQRTLEKLEEGMRKERRAYEVLFRNKDGGNIWVETNSTPVKIGDNLQYTLVSWMDITERKRADSELKLRAALLDSANDSICLINEGGTLTYVNEKYCQSHGYTRDELIGMNIRDMDVSRDEEHFESLTRELGEKGEAVFEAVHRRKDGSEMEVEVHSRIIEEGGHDYNLNVERDISERKQTERKIQELYRNERELRQNLEEEMKRRVEFTRALVHELKTPITPISAGSELMMEELEEGPLMNIARTIHRSSLKMSNRIDMLLDVARGELGILDLEYHEVKPRDMLDKVVKDMVSLASRQHISLVVDIPETLPVLNADENRLEQVIQNLLTNSFKWSREETTVTVKARKMGPSLVIEVKDEGIGISQENQARIFEPYYSVRNSGHHFSGLGLGLALCKTIVESHGGSIWVDSEEGKGSTFGFSIPFKAGTSRRAGAN